MAPKRALEQVDANVQSQRDAKQRKRDEAEKGAETQEQTRAVHDSDVEVYLKLHW